MSIARPSPIRTAPARLPTVRAAIAVLMALCVLLLAFAPAFAGVVPMQMGAIQMNPAQMAPVHVMDMTDHAHHAMPPERTQATCCDDPSSDTDRHHGTAATLHCLASCLMAAGATMPDLPGTALTPHPPLAPESRELAPLTLRQPAALDPPPPRLS